MTSELAWANHPTATVSKRRKTKGIDAKISARKIKNMNESITIKKSSAESKSDSSDSESDISSRESSVEIILPESRNTQPPTCPSQQTQTAPIHKHDPQLPPPSWVNVDKWYADGWIEKRLDAYDRIMSKFKVSVNLCCKVDVLTPCRNCTPQNSLKQLKHHKIQTLWLTSLFVFTTALRIRRFISLKVVLQLAIHKIFRM